MNTLAPRPPVRLRSSDEWARPEDERIVGPDVHHILSILRRRARLFAAMAGLVLLAAFLFTLTRIPVYTANVQLVVEPHKKDVTATSRGEDGPAGAIESPAVETEVEVLRSPSLTQSVVDKLGLAQDPEFNPPPEVPRSFLSGLGGLFGQRAAAPVAPRPVDPNARLAIAKRVAAGLEVSRAGSTYVLNLAYTSKDPVKAARIANAYAEQYLGGQLNTKLDATRQANLLFNTRLESLRAQVHEAESAVESYKAENNLLTAGNSTLTEQEVQGLEQRLTAARDEVAAQEARLATAKARIASGGTGEDLGEILDSPVVQNLRGQIAEASKHVADLQTTYGPNFPDVHNAIQQRAALEGQLRAEIGRIISRVQSQVDVARASRDSLEASVLKARKTLASSNQAQVKLRELEQTAEAIRTLYASFLAGAKTTSTAEGLELTDARILSAAEVPARPSAPRIKLNMALGLVLALLAGLAAVIVAQLLDTTLSTAEDIERKLNMPHLPAIPALSSAFRRLGFLRDSPVDYILKKPRSPLAESFRSLRAALTLSGNRIPRIIAVTSALPGEGKTTTSLCLARILGLAGSRVVLVDCDIRRQHSSAQSRLPSVGLMEVLFNRASLEDALVRDGASGAYFLPIAPAAEEDDDIFASSAMKELLDRLRERFDIILLDTPPVLAAADAMVLSAQSDLVVMLARWRKTPAKAVEAAIQALVSVNAVIAGVALTCVDQKRQSVEGYGDPGLYYERCKKYYQH